MFVRIFHSLPYLDLILKNIIILAYLAKRKIGNVA